MYDPSIPPPPPGMMQTMGAPVSGAYPMPQQMNGFQGMGRGQVGPMLNMPQGADQQAYIDQFRAWAAGRPEDKAARVDWRAQMPQGGNPLGHAQAIAAAPQAQAPAFNQAMTPYPVTQHANPSAHPMPVKQGYTGQNTGIVPPNMQTNPQSYTSGFAPQNPAPRPMGSSGGGFFGTRKGR